MEALVQMFSYIIEYLTMQIESLVQMVRLVPDITSALFDAVVLAPGFLLPFLTFSITISLVFAFIKIM